MNGLARRIKQPVLAARHLRAKLIDRCLRIDTSTPVNVGERRSVHADSVHYEPPDYPRLAHTLRAARIGPDDVVYEIGCGMGRVVCMIARRRVARVIGIEISAALAARAEQNLSRLRGKRSRAEIVVADAAKADYDGGTVYFLYNPFGDSTMRDVMVRIESSWVAEPRPIRVVYMHPVCRGVLDSQEWLRKIGEFKLPGYKSGTAMWESIDHPRAGTAERV